MAEAAIAHNGFVMNGVQTLYSITLNMLLSQKDQEVNELKAKLKEYDQRLNYQDRNIDGLRTRIKELEEEVRTLKQKFETSRKKLTDTQKKLSDVELKNSLLDQEIKAIQGDRNIVYLGEMCRRLQKNIYRYVFPKRIPISSKVAPKIRNLDNKITNNRKLTEEERKEATKIWEELKVEVPLNPEVFNLIEEIQSLRDTSAHPEITDEIKDVVFKAAEELNEQGVFELMASFEDIKKLIRIWEKTEDLVK